MFIYDLVDNRLDFLLELETARSRTWRPDGKYMLLLDVMPGGLESEQVILCAFRMGAAFSPNQTSYAQVKCLTGPNCRGGQYSS